MTKLKTYELNRISTEEFKTTAKLPVVFMLDNVRSAYNVGSVFRSCDCFPMEKIYLCGITGYPPNRQVLKTSLGAENTVSWEYSKSIVDVIKLLRDDNYVIVSVEQTTDSIKLHDFDLKKDAKYALIFGHEVMGVQEEIISLSDFCLEIPQFGTKHSLNIAVSAGIILWDFQKRILNQSQLNL